jgi:hypothetical protein
MASTRGRPPEARARQAAGMLARKGYPPGLAFRLIKEAMQQEGTSLDLDADAYLDPDAEDEAPGASQGREGHGREADFSL